MSDLKEISRTVRAALVGWPETVRLILIIIVTSTALVVIVRLAYPR